MKKKVLSIILVLATVVLGAVSLTACAGGKKYYFTVQDAPEHCSVQMNSRYTTKDNKEYAKAGEENGVSVYVDEGYYSDDFKILFNSQEVEAVTYTNDQSGLVYMYEYRFTPTEDFDITFSGKFEKIKKTFTVKKEDGSSGLWEPFDKNLPKNSEVYVRFAENNVLGFPSTETLYADFVTFNTRQVQLSYGDTLDFYVYSKGFKGEPVAFSLFSDNGTAFLDEAFYNEGGNVGIHYTFTQSYHNSTMTFMNAFFRFNNSISIAENSGHGNRKIGSEKLIIGFEEDYSALTITIKGYNSLPSETVASFADLKLRINGETQAVDFTDDDNGVFVIYLKKPYEYVPEDGNGYEFAYIVDFNFYTLPYFEGQEFTALD